MKIASQAQHDMFKKCVADPDYAKSRGIDADMAQQFLDAHKADGAPPLPQRAAAPSSSPGADKAPPKLLQSRRR